MGFPERGDLPCESLVMEDCAFMKAPTYNGQFMAMSFVDGNLNNVLLAEALTPIVLWSNHNIYLL